MGTEGRSHPPLRRRVHGGVEWAGRRRRLQRAGDARRDDVAPGRGAAVDVALPASDREPVRAELHHRRRRRALRGSPSVWSPCSRRASTRPSTTTPALCVSGELDEQLGAAIAAVTSLDPDRIRAPLVALSRDAAHEPLARDGPPLRAVPRPEARPSKVPGVPAPCPHEMFVPSPAVEGVHLRPGPVARGGIRWADRVEDYRTEILDLIKAQSVKNSVIVPDGAKGGFVVKRPPAATGDAAGDRSPHAEGAASTGGSSRGCSSHGRRAGHATTETPPPGVRATTATIPTSWWPRTRGRRRSPTSPTRPGELRVLAWRRVRLRRVGGLRPQGDRHHRPGRGERRPRHFRELDVDVRATRSGRGRRRHVR